MDEPAKPFACNMPDCGMSFTNEDHLHVHTKKHDMVLQLGLEQKAAFVADQTPTPTRFIRNCEEVGLFQDLQNVAANPFDEGFKRAMESKPGLLTLESTVTPPDDALHTPHFPLLDTSEATLYTNNQRNVTISRSSSDESGTIKEYETRTISKLTNEVTTISRYVNDDVTIKQTETQSDIQTVSYKNNIITIESIESNVVRKDDATVPLIVYPEKKNVTIDNSKLQIIEKIPIMSQRSIDLVVDNLTSELETNLQQTVLETDKTKELNAMKNIDIQNARKKLIEVLEKEHVRLQKDTKKLPQILPNTEKLIKSEIVENFEVHIKLPNGKSVRMTPVKEENDKQEHVIKAKEIIRNKIAKKTINKNINVVEPVKIASGTLIPVTLVNTEGTRLSNADLSKVPITKINTVEEVVQLIPDGNIVKTLATPVVVSTNIEKTSQNSNVACDLNVKIPKDPTNLKAAQKPVQADPDIVSASETNEPDQPKRSRMDLDSRSAASRRYRERLKLVMHSQAEENKRLKEINQKLIAEKAVLKLVITEHMKKCPHAGEIADRLNDLMNGADIL